MHAKIEQLHNVLSAAICGMTMEELKLHSEGKWSAAEILEHLNLTYTGTTKNLERRVLAGQPVSGAGRSGKRLQRFVVTRLGYMPEGRKSPEHAMPRGKPCEQVQREIFENLGRMDDVITRCEQQFPGGQPIAEHPVLGPLTAQEWRGFHLTHGKHHARQIAKLKRSR